MNAKNFSVGKDKRFSVPTKKVASPAPDKYKPLNSLNENFNSTFQKSAQTVIGKNNASIIDKHFNMQIASPGPGQYNRFSDFTGTH